MAKPVGSIEPFLEGYREQQQKQEVITSSKLVQATDVLEQFAIKKVNSMTIFELSSELMITPQEAKKLVEELSSKKLVSIEPGREKGNELVALTQRGKLYIQSET